VVVGGYSFLFVTYVTFVIITDVINDSVIEPQLAIARLRLHASMTSICLSVCLSVAKMQKNAIFSKTKQFRAMVSIKNDM